MKRVGIFLCAYVYACCLQAQTAKDFPAFRDKFIEGYKQLHIPTIELSYSNNLQKIQSAYDIQKQLDFFKDADKNITIFSSIWIADDERFDLDLMKFETNLNLQRLALEKKWIEEKPGVIPTNNIYSIPHGKGWYAYFLNRWLGAQVKVDEIFFNGTAEADRVKNNIETLSNSMGLSTEQLYTHLNNDNFFYKNDQDVKASFVSMQQKVSKELSTAFSEKHIKNVGISRGTNETLAQTPGYYNDDTLFYNYFDKPYSKIQVPWLYMHEAVPGHHYQQSIDEQTKKSKVQALFHYGGYAEGWAAYTETLGKQMGIFENDYDEIGRLEWDLVRSVRVILDIGLNYYGWTDDKALETWKQYIPNQDEIAMREINRMHRWPAQVITYKYGSTLILQWKKELQEKQGNAFNIKDFHDRILNSGTLPFFMVKKNVFRKTKDSTLLNITLNTSH